MRRTLYTALAAVTLVSPLTASAEQAEHEIRMDRPMTAGTSWDVRVDGRLEERAVSIVSGERRLLEAQETLVVLDAVAEVRSVSPAGAPTGMSYLVQECTVTRNGVTAVIAGPGQVLEATLLEDGSTGFTVEDRRVPAGWSDALELVAGLAPGPALRDAVFGSDVPRAIGESWPVDDDLANGTGRWSALTTGRSALAGKTTLREVQRRDEMTCLLLEAELEVTGMPAAGGPPGLEAAETQWTLRFESLLPLDRDLPAIEETSRLHTQLVLKGLAQTPHEGAAMLLTSNRVVHRTRSRHVTAEVATGADARD